MLKFDKKKKKNCANVMTNCNFAYFKLILMKILKIFMFIFQKKIDISRETTLQNANFFKMQKRKIVKYLFTYLATVIDRFIGIAISVFTCRT